MGIPVPTPLPQLGDVLADKYLLEAELGRGGMGAVFRARHLLTGKRVAIKCQLPNDRQEGADMGRFLAEARAAAAVSHPNIVDVYDVGETSGALFLVMEYLDGKSLSESLGRGPLPIGPVVRTMLSAMRGVQAAHRAGVVHRDLKPDNIFLSRDADGALEAKVLDFGIAKLRSKSESFGPSLTLSGTIMGTPHYMSPEQAQDSSSVDARTDVYSLGVILYELLSGTRPFDGESLTAVLLSAARGDCAPLRSLRPEVPAALADAIAKAMAPNPSQRFDRVGAFMEALQPFAASEGLAPFDISLAATSLAPGANTSLAVQSARGEHTSSRLRRRGLWMALALLLLSGGLLALRQLRGPQQAGDGAAPGEGASSAPARAPSAAQPPRPPPVAVPPAAEAPAAEPPRVAPEVERQQRPRASARRDARERAAAESAKASEAAVQGSPRSGEAPSSTPAPPTETAPATTTRRRLAVDLERDQF